MGLPLLSLPSLLPLLPLLPLQSTPVHSSPDPLPKKYIFIFLQEGHSGQSSSVQSTPVHSSLLQSTPVHSGPLRSTPVLTPCQKNISSFFFKKVIPVGPVQSSPLQSNPVHSSPLQSTPVYS